MRCDAGGSQSEACLLAVWVRTEGVILVPFKLPLEGVWNGLCARDGSFLDPYISPIHIFFFLPNAPSDENYFWALGA